MTDASDARRSKAAYEPGHELFNPAPERIWLPIEHAEDAANQPTDDLAGYVRADLHATVCRDLSAALAANQLLVTEHARLLAFLEDFTASNPDVISGRHPHDRSGQSDVDDMINAGDFYAWQQDAKTLLATSGGAAK